MNLIDFTKAAAAANAITDNASRELVQEVIPVVHEAISAVINTAQDRFDASAGNALGAVTAERIQFVNDTHGLLDRLNGAKVLFVDGGFELRIPERK